MRRFGSMEAGAIATMLLASVGPANASPEKPPLAAVFAAFTAGGDPHASQVVSAIEMSPRLVERLSDLASSGVLKSIVLEPDHPGFQASHKDGVISLTPKFVEDQTPPGDINPDLRARVSAQNIVFVFGYMSSMLQTAPAVQAAEAQLLASARAAIKAAPPGQSFDATEVLLQNAKLHMRDEASAYFEGWNDEVDAARHAANRPLTPVDFAALLVNGRNSRPLIAVLGSTSGERLQTDDQFMLQASEHNLQVMGTVLGHTNVPDFM
jgi:hypothetical protein